MPSINVHMHRISVMEIIGTIYHFNMHIYIFICARILHFNESITYNQQIFFYPVIVDQQL